MKTFRHVLALLLMLTLILCTTIGHADVPTTQPTVPAGFVLRLEARSSTDPAVAAKVTQLVQACKASGAATDYDKTLWFHNWLINNANYDYTYTEYGPEGVLLKGTGVCQSYAEALKLLLDEVGIENMIIASDEMNHAWNLVKLNGHWCHIDATWDDPGTGGEENHLYFGLNDDFMGRDHVWDRSAYPACTSPDLNYYLRQKAYPGVGSQAEFNAAIAAEIAKGNLDVTFYNTACDGFDLREAALTWHNEESWRTSASLSSYYGGAYLLTVRLIVTDPDYGAAEYTGNTDEFRTQIGELLAQGCTTIALRDSTDAAFDPEALYDMLYKQVQALAPEYGCSPSYSWSYSEANRAIFITVTYLTLADLPEPYPLTSSYPFYTFSATDTNGAAITNQTYTGKRVLHVIGRTICPNTQAFLASLSPAAAILKQKNVEVVINFIDLDDSNKQSVTESYPSFHCTNIGFGSAENGLLAYFELLDEQGYVWFPVVFLADTNGDIIYASSGYVQNPLKVVATTIYGKTGSNRIVIPASVTEIADETFMGCTGVTEVHFEGSSVTTIGEYAFANCTDLKRVILPNSVTNLASTAFQNCPNLTVFISRHSKIANTLDQNKIPFEIID